MSQTDQLVVQLTVLQKGMKKALADLDLLVAKTKGISPATASASKGLKNMGKEATKAGNQGAGAMKNMRRAILGAVAVMGAFKAIQFGKEIFEQTAAFGELADQIDNTFGKESAGRIKEYAKTISNSVGRSIPELLTVAGQLRLRLARSFSNKDAEDLVKPLMLASADLSSIFDRDMKEVSAALASALTGTVRPGAALGLALKVSDLAEFAKVSKSQITNLKTEARQRLIIAKIRHDALIAEGDAARTIDSLSNRVRALKARWENIIFLNRDTLAPIFHQMVDIVENIGSAISRAHTSFTAFADGVTPAQVNFLKILGIILAIKAMLAFPLLAIAGIAAAVVLLIDDFEVWRQGGQSMIGAIDGMGETLEGVITIVTVLGEFFIWLGGLLWTYLIKPIIIDLWQGFQSVVKGIIQLMNGDFLGGIYSIFRGLIPWILTFFGGPLFKIFGKLGGGLFRSLFGRFLPAVQGMLGKMLGFFVNGFGRIRGIVMGALGKIPGFNKLFGVGKTLGEEVLTNPGINKAAAGAIGAVKNSSAAQTIGKGVTGTANRGAAAIRLTPEALAARANQTSNSSADNRQATINNTYNMSTSDGPLVDQIEGVNSSFDPFSTSEDIGLDNE